ncbi:MATE efflux family protein 5-like [Pyrus ussuriensis x Pyrus communis]|uniref:MATE efflux family protein 5-like n=1 Tax=Pyrus ussuriensis x Pyrus communis TaxID=2448454 RepID=A0A5N5H390_9ROSA|nr:MATE efflux family protein 5-like [Pyrus ussuriensis x Pyrus communis]
MDFFLRRSEEVGMHSGTNGCRDSISELVAGHFDDDGRPPGRARSLKLLHRHLPLQRHRLQSFHPVISHEAGKFTIWLIPALFAYATLQPLIRYFQTQSLITPMLISSCVTLVFHIPLCWLLVFKSGLNNLGGALAISISYWVNVILLALYMKFSVACSKTRVPISMEVFHGIGEFFRFAIPSAIMICLEWWSFELLILLSGLLPNPALETSVLSVCLQTISTLYAIPFGFAAAASTRVSNELGAGNPQGAQIATFAAMFLAVTETTITTTTLFACRNVFGYTFSDEKEVIDYVTIMAPLVCLAVTLDSLHGVLSEHFESYDFHSKFS